MPGIHPGIIDPKFTARISRYAFTGVGELGALTYPLGRVELASSQKGRVIGAGFTHGAAADATGDIDYVFRKIIAAGNGGAAAVEGVQMPLQKSPARGSLVSVAANTMHVVHRESMAGKATAGAATTITLATADAGVDDDEYEGCLITIVAGTGKGQVRRITDYVQSTRVATVDAAWTTNPDATSEYVIEPQLAHSEDEPQLGAAQAGAATTITLEARKAVRIDDYYNNSIVTNLATGESKLITDYAQATQVASVASAWAQGNPAASTPYRIDHDCLIVRPGDALIAVFSGPGIGINPPQFYIWADMLELSDINTNNLLS